MARRLDRSRKAVSVSIPAPVGGLNTRDALAAMEPIYAVAMRDLFPNGTHVEVRKGDSISQTLTGMNSSSHFPGFIRYGETSMWMAVYDQAASEMELKSLSGSTQTITGHAVTYTPVYTNFANSAGNFVAVIFRNNSAANNYYTYDGTTWTARTGTTTNSQAFSYVQSFKNRLWFLTDASGKQLSAYYLPTLAITGTTVEFPLGGVASKGGQLYAIGAWTRDGGEGGADDLIVFTTTAGQAIIYQGSDPASSATWGLVGVFDISRPVGAPFKYGSDLLLPCEDGLFSMTAILSGQSGPEFALSDIIRPTWQDYAATEIASGRSAIGNTTIAYSPQINHLMVMFRGQNGGGRNVSAQLLVMNTITKAWTEYVGVWGYNVDAFGGDIYFGNLVDAGGASFTAKAYKFGGGVTLSEGGSQAGFCIPAYTALGSPGTIKQITAIRPSLAFEGTGATAQMSGAVDFQYRTLGDVNSTPKSDTINTASGTISPMLSIPMTGTYISVGSYFAPASGSTSIKWFSTDVLFNIGGFV